MELKGKTVFVTGGAKRIGKAIALGFAQKGCDVVLHYNQSLDAAKKAQEEIQQLGVKCSLLQCDFTQKENVSKLLDDNKEILSHVSILINSASLFDETPLSPRSTEAVKNLSDALFFIHYEAPLRLSQSIGLTLKNQNKEGVIINITDAMLRYPFRHYNAYFASKGALETLTKTLVLELAPNVRVNAVAPGCILYPDNYSEDQKNKILESIPLKRKGEPEDIASACMMLAEMDYMNGITLTVDGGRTL